MRTKLTRARKLIGPRGALAAALTLAAVAVLPWPGQPTRAATGAETAAETTAAGTEQVSVCLATTRDTAREQTLRVPRAAADVLLRYTLSYEGVCASYGAPSALGAGELRTYAQLADGRPQSVGIVFPKSTLTGLPTAMTDGKHCYDMNGDGSVNEHTECVGGHERPLELPAQLASFPDMPLKWALVNYNPMGHGPEHIYDSPHFDFHFYVQPKAERDAIRTGPCGLAIDCEDFATATKPLPPQYLPQDYQDNGVAEAAMGNHLVDMSSGEWHGESFTQTFIYGAYDAKISFLEPMISKAWLQGVAAGTNPSRCWPVKQPQQWQEAGWYPQEYCIEYRANRGEYTVSMRNFRHSAA
ncbi:hypothetical protein AB0E83_27775 [Streptomyces sp. NPDC035033]|uniref:hypothetical protein n=1 Tax=Streptomyces sp. NPDC035033 TaxID=3155368 RepID=UPI0033C1F872